LSGRKGFIPFVTAGDPDLETSLSIVKTLADGRADLIELGIPFSDPMADGPTIQASSQRSLAKGTTVTDVIDLVRQFRSSHDTPIVLFGYLNPLLQSGLERFREDAADVGIDGVLITDVIDNEALEIRDLFAERDIDLISLVAPTTSDERLRRIATDARGFIYAVSRTGVTGASIESSLTAQTLVNRVRRYTDLPVAVGFGISTREQVEATWRYADAAVVGSAIVNEIANANSPSDAVDRVRSFVQRVLPQVAKSRLGI
jgi:tryptophan synthase alpha chain